MHSEKLEKQFISKMSTRSGFGCTVYEDRLYVFGGMIVKELSASAQFYDFGNDVWKVISPMKFKRRLILLEKMKLLSSRSLALRYYSPVRLI